MPECAHIRGVMRSSAQLDTKDRFLESPNSARLAKVAVSKMEAWSGAAVAAGDLGAADQDQSEESRGKSAVCRNRLFNRPAFYCSDLWRLSLT